MYDKLRLISVVLCCILVSGVLTMNRSRELEGDPAGYLQYCPGDNKDVPLPTKELKYLTISVQRKPTVFAFKSKYNYYQMKELASNPAVDFSKPTVMYVGGYLDHPNYPPGLALGTTYKKLGYTVLLLNTNWFTTVDYALATRNIRTVGKHAAEMLAALSTYGLNPKRLQLVGLSLGAQTMSFIAKHYKLLTGINIARLTGLDPAGPCFRHLGPQDRLDDSDADFVDVILTNIDGFGMATPMGHVNFYVNGGEFQQGDFFWAPCGVFCSHIRSLTLWVAALYNPDGFIAIKCNSVQQARDKLCYDNTPQETNLVGLKTDTSKHGVFYLATKNNYPYFMGEEGLKRENEFFNWTHLCKREPTHSFCEIELSILMELMSWYPSSLRKWYHYYD